MHLWWCLVIQRDRSYPTTASYPRSPSGHRCCPPMPVAPLPLSSGAACELSCRWPIHPAQMAKTAYVFGHSLARNGQNNLETFAISTTRGQFRTTHDAYDTSGQPALEHRISGAWPTRCTWPICLSSELSDGQSIVQGTTTTYNHRSKPYDPQTQTYVHAPPQRDTNPLDDGKTTRRGDRGGGRTKECGQA